MPQILTTDGVRLWASDDGAGPSVVLVAGYTAPAASWALQVDVLTAAGYRAIALDRRSHGRSEAPWFGQRMARHGADLSDALTQLDLGPVVLVGGSMGASTIWAYVDLFVLRDHAQQDWRDVIVRAEEFGRVLLDFLGEL